MIFPSRSDVEHSASSFLRGRSLRNPPNLETRDGFDYGRGDTSGTNMSNGVGADTLL